MKIGRNDPCHCGSGKKYKKCCLANSQPGNDELKKRRWSVIQAQLIPKIMTHAIKVYGVNSIDEAFEEFYLFNTDTGFDPECPELPVFIPWFLYEWHPIEKSNLPDMSLTMPPAKSLAETGQGLSNDEKAFLLECCQTSFSFFEILEIAPDISLKLKDVLTEEFHIVLEKSATRGIQKEDLIFGKVIHIDGIDILEACAPIIIRPKFKLQILDLKSFIKKKNKVITQEVLHDYRLEVLDEYRAIYEAATNPPKPILCNTDDQLLIPHKMTIDIIDAHATFEALHTLCPNESKEQLLAEAKFNSSGTISSIDFPWLKKGNKKHKGWDNTVLGHIEINENQMIVEVNSKERARKFKNELKKRMPTGWTLKSTVIESIEAQLKKMNSSNNISVPSEHEELMQNPEVHQLMENMMKSHWDNWPMESIPALAGLRPIDAAKTVEGRERLNVLLTQFERDIAARPMVGQTLETIKEVRKKLGI